MKALFIETKYLEPITIPEEVVKALPGRIMLFTTVQFAHQLEHLKKQLSGKEIFTETPGHSQKEGQMLGCATMEFKGDFDAFFYVGDGLFHPKALALGNDKPIYLYNPFNGKFGKMDRSEMDRALRRQEAAKKKFYASENIGLILSVKPGQHYMQRAKKIQDAFPEKNWYLFITNTLDFNDVDNYPFIDVFVNTMCPRIALDDTNKFRTPMINVHELLGIDF